MPNNTVYLTGANGFLGSDLAFFFREKGKEVIPMTCKADLSRNNYFDMRRGEQLRPAPKRGALVHCAWQMNALEENYYENNVGGSIVVLKWALENRLSSILSISTTSVFPGCRSTYGRAKQEVEEFCRSNGILVARSGLVCSCRQVGGMVGKLARIVNILPLVPIVNGGRQAFYISDTEDFASALLHLIEDPSLYSQEEPVLAASQPITFREILNVLGSKTKKQPVFVNIPVFLIRFPLYVAAKIGLKLPVSDDNLEGLLSLPPTQPINSRLTLIFKHSIDRAMSSID